MVRGLFGLASAVVVSAQDPFLKTPTQIPPKEVSLDWLVPLDRELVDSEFVELYPESSFFVHNATLNGEDSAVYHRDPASTEPTAVRLCCGGTLVYWLLGGCGLDCPAEDSFLTLQTSESMPSPPKSFQPSEPTQIPPREVGLEWLVPLDRTMVDAEFLDLYPESSFFVHNVTLNGEDSAVYHRHPSSTDPTAVRLCCGQTLVYWLLGGCGLDCPDEDSFLSLQTSESMPVAPKISQPSEFVQIPPREVSLEWLVPLDRALVDAEFLDLYPEGLFFVHNITLNGEDSAVYHKDPSSTEPTAVRLCCGSTLVYWLLGGCGLDCPDEDAPASLLI